MTTTRRTKKNKYIDLNRSKKTCKTSFVHPKAPTSKQQREAQRGEAGVPRARLCAVAKGLRPGVNVHAGEEGVAERDKAHEVPQKG